MYEWKVNAAIAAVHPKMGTDALPWPARKTEGAAGYDCCAAIDQPIELLPGVVTKIPLGFALALPRGFEAQVRPRSGLASRGIIMPNSPGTVDSDYRGEVSALLLNIALGVGEELIEHEPGGRIEERNADGIITKLTVTHVAVVANRPKGRFVRPGERVAQIIFSSVCTLNPEVVLFKDLSPTARGDGGFGSTGSHP